MSARAFWQKLESQHKTSGEEETLSSTSFRTHSPERKAVCKSNTTPSMWKPARNIRAPLLHSDFFLNSKSEPSTVDILTDPPKTGIQCTETTPLLQYSEVTTPPIQKPLSQSKPKTLQKLQEIETAKDQTESSSQTFVDVPSKRGRRELPLPSFSSHHKLQKSQMDKKESLKDEVDTHFASPSLCILSPIQSSQQESLENTIPPRVSQPAFVIPSENQQKEGNINSLAIPPRVSQPAFVSSQQGENSLSSGQKEPLKNGVEDNSSPSVSIAPQIHNNESPNVITNNSSVSQAKMEKTFDTSVNQTVNIQNLDYASVSPSPEPAPYELRDPEDWSAQDVANWLANNNLGHYKNFFLEHRITGSDLTALSLSTLIQPPFSMSLSDARHFVAAFCGDSSYANAIFQNDPEVNVKSTSLKQSGEAQNNQYPSERHPPDDNQGTKKKEEPSTRPHQPKDNHFLTEAGKSHVTQRSRKRQERVFNEKKMTLEEKVTFLEEKILHLTRENARLTKKLACKEQKNILPTIPEISDYERIENSCNVDPSLAESLFQLEAHSRATSSERVKGNFQELMDITRRASFNRKRRAHDKITLERFFKKRPPPSELVSRKILEISPVTVERTKTRRPPQAKLTWSSIELGDALQTWREQEMTPLLDIKSNEWFRLELGRNSPLTSRPVEFEDPERFEKIYQQHFYDKDHVNFVGELHNGSPVLISICSSPEVFPYGLAVFRAIERTVEGDRCIFVEAGEAGVSRPSRKAKQSTYPTAKYLLKMLRMADPSIAKARRLSLVPALALKKELVQWEKRKQLHCLTVGVLFVCPSQTEEQAMLANNDPSPAFLHFLSFLGEKIVLKDWKGFKGGLDVQSDATGTHSIFTVWRDIHIMFHVSTLLPFSAKDSQQI